MKCPPGKLSKKTSLPMTGTTTIKNDCSIDEFLELIKLVFKCLSVELSRLEALFKNLDRAYGDRGCRKICIAVDDQRGRNAGIYLIWEKNSAYYLIEQGDLQLCNSGATSLCMWAAIKLSASARKAFDFGGAMMEPVERFFRSGCLVSPLFFYVKSKFQDSDAAFLFEGLNHD